MAGQKHRPTPVLAIALAASAALHLSVLGWLEISPGEPRSEPQIALQLYLRARSHAQKIANVAQQEGVPAGRLNRPDSNPPDGLRSLASAAAQAIAEESAASGVRDDDVVSLPIAMRQQPETPGPATQYVESELHTEAATASLAELVGIRIELMSWLERYKRYPPAARRRGIQGATLVRFVIAPSGQLLKRELLRSSGSRHLDVAAMKLLLDAAPYPPLPDTLRLDSLEVELPIVYRLAGDGRPT